MKINNYKQVAIIYTKKVILMQFVRLDAGYLVTGHTG